MNRRPLLSLALAPLLWGCGASTLQSSTSDAAVDAVDAARDDVAADTVCGILCAAPPPGCHYEGPVSCAPPSCGRLVCADAGTTVSCGGATSVFPSFGRACSAASDCFVAIHQSDCCGSHQAFGLATSERDAFQSAETACERMYPGCGCAGRPTVVDDGSTATSDSDIVATCDSGRCTTHVRHAPMRHRVSDAACATAPAAGACPIPSGPPVSCHADSDCSTGRNGRCIGSRGGAFTCFCTYDTCARDSDCSMGGPCACHGEPYAGGSGNTCVPGNCRTDSDCGAGGYCSPSLSPSGCGGLGGYYCHTPQDLCVDDEDCSTSSGPQSCSFVAARARWECQPLLACP